MLRQRLATAAVGLPILIAVVLIGGPLFAVALSAFVFAGCLELCQAAGFDPRRPESLLAATLGAGLVPATYAHADVQSGLLVAAVILPLLAAVIRADVDPRPVLPAWLVLPAAVLYAGFLGHYLLLVRRFPHGLQWTLLLMLGTFATDTGAYAVGRLFGRHKLAPRISPAKTLEGAIGGLLAAVIAVVALDYLLDLPHNPPLIALLGALVGVAAQFGDLSESAVKRRFGVKDMGRIFPGHGGVLDRLDSLLFVAPVIYFFARWLII